MKANDDNHKDAKKMSKVECVKISGSDHRKCSDENYKHNGRTAYTSKDQRCPPDTQSRRIPRPSFVVKVGRVQHRDNPSKSVRKRVEDRYPGKIEKAVRQDEEEQRICREHVVGQRRRWREFEERCECTMSGDGHQDHSHGNIAEVTGKSNSRQSVASTMDAIGISAINEVVSETPPPDRDHHTVQRYDPENREGSAEREPFPYNRQFPFDKLFVEDLLHSWMERSHGEKGGRDGDPGIPYQDVQACLERKQPFSASARVTMMVGSKGESDRKAKGQDQTTGKRPEACSRGDASAPLGNR